MGDIGTLPVSWKVRTMKWAQQSNILENDNTCAGSYSVVATCIVLACLWIWNIISTLECGVLYGWSTLELRMSETQSETEGKNSVTTGAKWGKFCTIHSNHLSTQKHDFCECIWQ